VPGLYNITPEAITRPQDNYITNAANYGEQYQTYNGLLVNVSARPRNGLTIQGGINVGTTVQDMCEVRDQVPEVTGVGRSGITPTVNVTNPHCRSDPRFLTRVTGFGVVDAPADRRADEPHVPQRSTFEGPVHS
jgi:hypothetical protein